MGDLPTSERQGQMIHTFLFIDTEFTSLEHPELISLGITTNDGKELYAERTDFARERCSGFVMSEVLPLIGYSYSAAVTAAELTSRLGRWLQPLADRHLIVAYDYAHDMRLFMSAVPEPCRHLLVPLDARWGMSDEALVDYFALPGVIRHHALHDARALHRACERWVASLLVEMQLVERELAILPISRQLAFWRSQFPTLGGLHPARAIAEGMLDAVLQCARSAGAPT